MLATHPLDALFLRGFKHLRSLLYRDQTNKLGYLDQYEGPKDFNLTAGTPCPRSNEKTKKRSREKNMERGWKGAHKPLSVARLVRESNGEK